MGGRGSSSRGKSGGMASVIAPQPQPQVQPQQVVIDNGAFKSMTDSDALALINANQDSYGDPDFIMAQKLYISSANVKGDGYSFSQNLNYKLDNNMKLDANEKWINDNLQNGMHAIGKNTNLVRYCHDDILKQAGISDYTKLTNAQLQSKLIGTKLKSNGYVSTSYNASKSPFAPNAALGGGREVVMNIKAKANTKVVFGAKAQTEVILNKGTSMKITNIKFDGSYATPRNSSSKPRVVVDIEVE